jgi:hypothetical protein
VRFLPLFMAAIVLTACGDSEKSKLTEQKREFVTQRMLDPGTAQFKDEKLTKQGWLCGRMNSKNAFGAYVGFKRFAARNHDDAWIEGVGYAGKPGAHSTDQTFEAMDAQIRVLGEILEAKKANPGFVRPSDAQIESMAEIELFEDRWKKHCA